VSDELTVQYERKFSDGNYGSEGYSMTWTWTPEEDGGPGEALEAAALLLRHLVLTQLAGSLSSTVSFSAMRELHAKDPKPDGEAEPAAEDLEDLPY